MYTNQLGVSIDLGVRMSNYWPTPFLFHPTSVVMIACSGESLASFRENGLAKHGEGMGRLHVRVQGLIGHGLVQLPPCDAARLASESFAGDA